MKNAKRLCNLLEEDWDVSEMICVRKESIQAHQVIHLQMNSRGYADRRTILLQLIKVKYLVTEWVVFSSVHGLEEDNFIVWCAYFKSNQYTINVFSPVIKYM